MYCPRCGEEQSAGNLRFCNRCGLPLGLVSELINNDGTLPILEEVLKKKKVLTRRNGVIFSLIWFILFVPFGAAFWGILDIEELAVMSAVFGLFSSILLLIISIFYLSKPEKNIDIPSMIQNQQENQKNLQSQPANQRELPPQQTQPASAYTSPQAGLCKAPDTGELVSPGSVTETTTKLLSKEEEL